MLFMSSIGVSFLPLSLNIWPNDLSIFDTEIFRHRSFVAYSMNSTPTAWMLATECGTSVSTQTMLVAKGINTNFLFVSRQREYRVEMVGEF